MLNAIAKPFGALLLWLYSLVGNYGVAILLFAIVVKLVLLPFQMKSKKSMMRMNSLTAQVKALEKRHEGNQRKYQEEVSKLYKEEHVNPMSGCLWSLIPFPILIALYQAIRYPLTVMMGVGKELVSEGGAIFTKLTELGFHSTMNAGYVELDMSRFISEHFDEFAGLSDKLVQINYKFLGLNLGEMPQWNFFTKVDWSELASWLPALGLFLIPIISGFMSWLSMKISQNNTPRTERTAAQEQAQQQMKMMNLMMPLVSVYIGFIMPAALGIYWIFNSVLMIFQDLALNAYYGRKMARENAEREERFRLREAELERKRQETERKRAEGATVRNENTSKKKLQAKQKAELDEVRAAAIREERTKRREKLGITEEETPASQVGNRRYARGRAYVEDRFTNPEMAAEATAAAAAASELDEALTAEAERAADESCERAQEPNGAEAPASGASADEETAMDDTFSEDEDAEDAEDDEPLADEDEEDQ